LLETRILASHFTFFALSPGYVPRTLAQLPSHPNNLDHWTKLTSFSWRLFSLALEAAERPYDV
jgi:hypothetical protein